MTRLEPLRDHVCQLFQHGAAVPTCVSSRLLAERATLQGRCRGPGGARDAGSASQSAPDRTGRHASRTRPGAFST